MEKLVDNKIIGGKGIFYIGIISFGFFLFLYLDCINVSIAFDDAYTMKMSQLSFSDIFYITSQDVHPPLYYWLLKMFSSIFGYSIFVQRLFSNIGVLAIMLLGMFAFRKRLGSKVSFIFLALLTAFPVTQFLASEMRMYSWAMFFTLSSGLFAFDSYYKGRNVDYVKLLFFALCAAYTHYYALMTVGWIFVVLFVCLWHNKQQVYKLLITIFVFVILYLPWLSHLLYQVEQVNNEYWIAPLTVNDIFYHIYYFFSIKKDWLPFDSHVNTILMLGTIIIILTQFVMLFYMFVRFLKTRNARDTFNIIVMLVFALPVISGLVFSIVVRPVLVPRYMLCSFGILLLGLALLYERCWSEKRFKLPIVISLVFLIALSSIRYFGTTRYLKTQQDEIQKLESFMNKYSDEVNTFLSEHYAASALSRTSVLFPDNDYYILTYRQSKETFAPFNIKRIYRDQPFVGDFILVQKEKNEGGQIGADFKNVVENNFQITDSVKGLNMELYRVKPRSSDKNMK